MRKSWNMIGCLHFFHWIILGSRLGAAAGWSVGANGGAAAGATQGRECDGCSGDGNSRGCPPWTDRGPTETFFNFFSPPSNARTINAWKRVKRSFCASVPMSRTRLPHSARLRAPFRFYEEGSYSNADGLKPELQLQLQRRQIGRAHV